jgi:hypothetical protein
MLKYPLFPAVASSRRRKILTPLAAIALFGSMMLVLLALGSITPTASADSYCDRPDPPPICDGGGEEDPSPPSYEYHEWSLRDDMTPNAGHDSPWPNELPSGAWADRYGNTRVWGFLGAPSPNADPATVRPLNRQARSTFGLYGLACLRQAWDDSLPAGCQNLRTDNPYPFGIDWAPGTVLMHPGPADSAIAAWRSPYSGTMRIEGSVRDLHAACGDGFRWSVWHGSRTVASAFVANGAAMPFSAGDGAANLNAVHVRSGDTIYLQIAPGAAGDHACDSTGVEMIIRQDA